MVVDSKKIELTVVRRANVYKANYRSCVPFVQESTRVLFDKILSDTSNYLSFVKQHILFKTFKLAHFYHRHQKRKSGEPYIEHPLEVACRLSGDNAEFNPDLETLAAAILHDAVEDTELTLEDIRRIFGIKIAELVDGVTKLEKVREATIDEAKAENLRKFILAVSGDLRVLFIKLADRLHNMRTLVYHPNAQKRRRIALETYEIYAPLAERLGMYHYYSEMQSLAFIELYPEEYEKIDQGLKDFYANSEEVANQVIDTLKKLLRDARIKTKVFGRRKSHHSIWKKMNEKNFSFEQLSDVIAFRIIVPSEADCYLALGLIHRMFPVMPGKFKDYISMPKPNGYQSLHTVVLDTQGHEIEIQIRTFAIHEAAENGYAAHWVYKQGQKNINTDKDNGTTRWLRNLVNTLKSANSAEDVISNTKMEMFSDSVFVFSPKGDVYELEQDATALDFAYAIHSDIGDSCISVKINRRIVPLRTKLSNGDYVEVFTSPKQKPSLEWLNWVATSRSKMRIRRALKIQHKNMYLKQGREIFNQSLKRSQLNIDNDLFVRVLSKLNYHTEDAFFTAIGDRTLDHKEVLLLIAKELEKLNQKNAVVPVEKQIEKINNRSYNSISSSSSLLYEVDVSVAHKMAKCCHPLPGDLIIGVVANGSGIAIHRNNCKQILKVPQQEKLYLTWRSSVESKDMEEENIDSTKDKVLGQIVVIVNGEKGIISEIIEILSKQGGVLKNIRIVSNNVDFLEMLIDVEVCSLIHLNSIIASLRINSYIVHANRN